jgi:hypothetical protein
MHKNIDIMDFKTYLVVRLISVHIKNIGNFVDKFKCSQINVQEFDLEVNYFCRSWYATG